MYIRYSLALALTNASHFQSLHKIFMLSSDKQKNKYNQSSPNVRITVVTIMNGYIINIDLNNWPGCAGREIHSEL